MHINQIENNVMILMKTLCEMCSLDCIILQIKIGDLDKYIQLANKTICILNF